MAGEQPKGKPDPLGALRHFPDILRAVTSGYGLAALGILVVFVLAVTVALFGVAANAATVLYALVAVLIVFVVSGLFFVGRAEAGRVASAGAAEPDRYDVYVSAPMDGLTEVTDFANLKQDIEKIKVDLRRECKLDRVFYAGTDLSFGKWQEPSIGLKDNWHALRGSRYFLMIYPRYVPSSIVFEAGLAIGLGKPSVWFVREGEKLPYLLRGGAGASGDDGLPLVRVIPYNSVEDIQTAFAVDKDKLFGVEQRASR